MSASFHNSQQEITKIGNFRNSRRKLSNSREIPPGIFDVADSREFLARGLNLQPAVHAFTHYATAASGNRRLEPLFI